MSFHNEKELAKIRKLLESMEGSLGLPKNPTALDRFRYSIQQELVKFKIENDLKSYEFAEMLGIAESDLSKVLHFRVEKFSTDRLLNLLQVIKPNYAVSLVPNTKKSKRK